MAIGWANNSGRGRILDNGKLIASHARCRSTAAGPGLHGNGRRVPCCMQVQLSAIASAGSFAPDPYGHSAIGVVASILTQPLVLAWSSPSVLSELVDQPATFGHWYLQLQCPNSSIIQVSGDDITPGGRLDITNTTMLFIDLFVGRVDDGTVHASLTVAANVELNGGMLCSGSYGSVSNPFGCEALPPAGVQIFQSDIVLADPTDLSSLSFDNQLTRTDEIGVAQTHGGVYYGPVAFTGGSATATAVASKTPQRFGRNDETSGFYLDRDQVLNIQIERDGQTRQESFLQYGGQQWWTKYLLDITNAVTSSPGEVTLFQGPVSDTMTGPAHWITSAGGVTITNSNGYQMRWRGMFAKPYDDADPTPAGGGWQLAYMVVANGQIGWGPTTGHTTIPGPPFTGVTIPLPAPHTFAIGLANAGILPVNVTNKCPPYYCIVLIDSAGVEFGVQLTKSVQTWSGTSNGYAVTLAGVFTSGDHQSRYVLTITKGVTTWKFFTRLDWHAPTWDVCGNFGEPNNYQGIGCPPYSKTTAASPWFPLQPTTTDGSLPAVLSLKLVCPQTTRSLTGVCLCTCAGQTGGSVAQCVSLWECFSDGIGDSTGNFSTPTFISTTNVANPSTIGAYFNTWIIIVDPANPMRCRARWYNLDGPPAVDGSCAATPPTPPDVPLFSRCSTGGTIVGTSNPLTCLAVFVSIQINGHWGDAAFYGFQQVDLTTWGGISDIWNIGFSAASGSFNYCAATFYQTCNTVTGNQQCVRTAAPPTPPVTGTSCRRSAPLTYDYYVYTYCYNLVQVPSTDPDAEPGDTMDDPDGTIDTSGTPHFSSYVNEDQAADLVPADQLNHWYNISTEGDISCYGGGFAYKSAYIIRVLNGSGAPPTPALPTVRPTEFRS